MIGSIPEAIYDLVSLKLLKLDHNQLSGQLSTALSKLSQLVHLNVSSNILEGDGFMLWLASLLPSHSLRTDSEGGQTSSASNLCGLVQEPLRRFQSHL